MIKNSALGIFLGVLLILTGCSNPNIETQKGSETSNSSKPIISSRRIDYIDSMGGGRFIFSSGKIKIIMEKLYSAAIEGKVEGYLDDSLKQKLSLKDLKERGGEKTTLVIPRDKDNPEITVEKDTIAYFEKSTLKSYYSLESMTYENKMGCIRVKAFCPAYSRNILGAVRYGTLFFIKTEDLSKALTPEEISDLLEFTVKSITVPSEVKNAEL